jgi:putative FmdB family regulatory protein
MPTYEYRCKDCGEHLEVVQSFTDDALTDCPRCGHAGTLRKVFGSIGITFKGSGFYKTDNRSSSGKAKAGSSGDGDKSSSKDGSSKESSSSSTSSDGGSTKSSTESSTKSSEAKTA